MTWYSLLVLTLGGLVLTAWILLLVPRDWADSGYVGSRCIGSRGHRRYLARLQRAAIADAETVRALSALTDDDRDWLKVEGWKEPAHAAFMRLNGLDVDVLPGMTR